MATVSSAADPRRSAPYRAAALLAVVLAGIAVGFAVFPPFDTTPRAALVGLGLLMLLLALLTLLVAPMVRDDWGLDASFLAMGIVAASAGAVMSTGLGQAEDAMIVQGIAVVAAYVRPQRRLVALVAAWMAIYAIAVSARPHFGGYINLVFLLGVIALAPLAVSLIAQRLRDQALHDPLTGQLNRRGLDTLAPPAVGLARRSGLDVAVAVADLDQFKVYNDAFGHRRGDDLLVDVATAWRDQLRRADLLARLGGDEFAFVLPDATPASCAGLVERLRAAYDYPFSIGFSQWGLDEQLASALERADADLYAHKHLQRRTRD